jgi:hypothetical protein
MRILLIEKKVAAHYDSTLVNPAVNPRNHSTENGDAETNSGADEEVALLPKKEEAEFRIPEGRNKLVRSLPILYCLSDPRLLTTLFVAFVQATLLATFDATIPTEAEALFGFSSLEAGLLFIALDVPYLLLGPIAGWAVEKYGRCSWVWLPNSNLGLTSASSSRWQESDHTLLHSASALRCWYGGDRIT